LTLTLTNDGLVDQLDRAARDLVNLRRLSLHYEGATTLPRLVDEHQSVKHIWLGGVHKLDREIADLAKRRPDITIS
jgi:hypothetical protein